MTTPPLSHPTCLAPREFPDERLVARERTFGTGNPLDRAGCTDCHDAGCPRLRDGLDVVMSTDLKTATCACCGRRSQA
jgi:hypothetical protein